MRCPNDAGDQIQPHVPIAFGVRRTQSVCHAWETVTQEIGAGDGTRTRDVQLGKTDVLCKQKTYAFTTLPSVFLSLLFSALAFLHLPY
ncbi:MAG: hypothetical protein A3H27_14485 [Acidobacteria bacterium RIFCSPLOWO2_02_FULL_59_13]|nr:MAG: hypothetical protein A3H27_14485 [Acidobacteria bacterium RIFCSPLOWO2_02_FULL_59_13]